MEELVSLFHEQKGIGMLSPEQTVTLLRCFMRDEEAGSTARKMGITVSEAKQCQKDLWNVFSYRKEVNRA